MFQFSFRNILNNIDKSLGDDSNLFSNYDATIPPTSSNDISQGYLIGSIWVDVVLDNIYMCVDNTLGNAVWKTNSLEIDDALSNLTSTWSSQKINSYVSDITTNATDIATNSTDIATNVTDIATNSTDIANTVNNLINTNTQVSANITYMQNNTGDITSNTADIATNTTDIANHVTTLATHNTDIATNATNITNNGTDIATNTANITNNDTDIATNVTNINSKFNITGGTITGLTSITNDFNVSPSDCPGITTGAKTFSLGNALTLDGGTYSGNVYDTVWTFNYPNATASSRYYAIRCGTSSGVNLFRGATSWSSSSDRNRKKNIIECMQCLDKLSRIKGYCFDYNSDDTDNSSRMGIIAQEVQAEFPMLVDSYQDEIGDTLSVRYSEMVPTLINAINELRIRVEALEV